MVGRTQDLWRKWHAIRDELRRSLEAIDSPTVFLTELLPERFDRPADIPSWFADESRCRDTKDRVYKTLLRLARSGPPHATIAWLLLLLGMWPSLERLLRAVSADDRWNDPIGDVLDAFTSLVDSLSLSTVNRVAAALSRGTRRELLATRGRHARLSARSLAVPDEDGASIFPEALSTFSPYDREERSFVANEGANDDEELETIRAELKQVVGDDADLVIGAAIYGENQRVLGERLGISHEAARKRYQRTLKRLEHRFARARRRKRCPTQRQEARFRRRKEGGTS